VTRDVLAPAAAIMVPQRATTAEVGRRWTRSRSVSWLQTVALGWRATIWSRAYGFPPAREWRRFA